MSKMHITYIILLQLITVTSIVQWKNTTSAKQLAEQQPPATKAKQVSKHLSTKYKLDITLSQEIINYDTYQFGHQSKFAKTT